MAWASEKKPAFVTIDGYKPSYSAVANIFQTYLRHTSNANLRLYPKEEHESKLYEYKAQLERELEQVGIAKHIAFDH